ncbi:MAG TPA: beta-ketoacyl-ACP synthase [Candidatus Binataceae bacterium]|nr:beta-ketoacyl-ACP synthase [Candidatus Binataceae bacterium]
MRRRVVVTGMGGITCLGEDWPTIRSNLQGQKTGVRYMSEWDKFETINTRLAAPIVGFDVSHRYDRKKLRTMGPLSRMAVYATERALSDAGLSSEPFLTQGRVGIAFGSSFGSAEPVLGFAELMTKGSTTQINGTSYLQMMSHTAAINIGLFFGITGRIIPTSSACTSSSQAIGYGAEAISYGMQDAMIVGGAEELNVSDAAVFDTLFATSTKNDTPQTTPRPFDRDRDGLVVGEGAATLILEEYEHARARGARIHAELCGYGTNSDGKHATQPTVATMAGALILALRDAGVQREAIGFVNGHGTATEWGDIAESEATAEVFGNRIPIHALKSYFGHSLGACAGIEAWLGIEMMKEQWFAPTANLVKVDERCAELDYVIGTGRQLDIEYFMSNNFAFGGVNTSLIFRRSL